MTLVFQPAEPNTGFVFVREDLPGKPRIPVCCENQVEMPLRTCLRKGSAQVEMTEHVLSALAGMWVDNCEIHTTAAEMPGLDGSALPIVNALESVGYEEQEPLVSLRTVSECLRESKSPECWVEMAPATAEVLTLGFELCYTNEPGIGRQSASFPITPEIYQREIAPARTFITLAEAQQILAMGLAKRATFQDLLVFDERGPIENVLRFPDECVRHKILDLLGDLTLGGAFLADVRGHRSGHALNVRLVRKLRESH